MTAATHTQKELNYGYPVDIKTQDETRPYNLVESVNGIGGENVASVIRFENAGDGVPYYVVVKSATSIETWSATPITFNAHAASYDFTTATSQAYGNNQILFDGIPSIYRGDTNQDGVIDRNDALAVYDNAMNFASPSSTDIDGDGDTDLTDLQLDFVQK